MNGITAKKAGRVLLYIFLIAISAAFLAPIIIVLYNSFKGKFFISDDPFALPNAEVMIHQPSGGAQGQATEIQIVAEKILQTKKKLNEILAANTGQPYEVICRDTERDNYMTAGEALSYGLIDKVITSR